jgi:pilus assembly protein Flp/PilA
MRSRNFTMNMKRRQFGQGMSEYIIITALIAVAGIGLFAAFGDTLSNQMAAMSQEMAGQAGDQDVQRATTTANTARTRATQNETLANYNQRN